MDNLGLRRREWRSHSGKHWVTVIEGAAATTIQSEGWTGCGYGWDEAIRFVESNLGGGIFQPDDAKTRMKEVVL